MAVFWYNTAVWPISLETSSCRMVLNQDGSLQVQLGETEIGQGADTAYSQMTADILGVPLEAVHIVSCQDTDVTPFGTCIPSDLYSRILNSPDSTASERTHFEICA